MDEELTNLFVPGGYDNVVLTTVPPPRVLARVLSVLSARWPELRGVSIPSNKNFTGMELPDKGEYRGEWGELLISRDLMMESHWDTTGGTLMPDGEGPITLIFRRVRDIQIPIGGAGSTVDMQEMSDSKSNAWLCSPKLWEITVVTPSDIGDGGFSSWIWNECKRACTGLST